MRRFRIRRAACIALTATMAATFTVGQALAFADSGKKSFDTVSAPTEQAVTFKDLTGKVDVSGLARQQLSDSVIDSGTETPAEESATVYDTRTVIVGLDTPALADRTGEQSVAEYTSTYEGGKALEEITASQNAFLAKLAGKGINYTLVDRYTTVINAVAIEVNTVHLAEMRAFAGVQSTGVSRTYAHVDAVEAQTNPSNVYRTGIYDSSEQVADGYDGSGVTVAILDTGLDYTHEAFSEMPATLGFDRQHVKNALDSGALTAVTRSRIKGQTLTLNDLYINDKVPFAYDYSDNDADVYPSYSQHGTHVAGIVAGKADSYVDKDGNLVNEKFRGVAPEAQLVICKVFTDDLNSEDLGGATSEDIIAALDDCVTLGVDIINMSLGTTSGFSSLDIPNDTEGDQLKTVYTKIKEHGISLISAAGNEYSAGFGSDFGTNLSSNPDSGTVGSPSTFVGAMSVASINGQTSPYMMANGSDPIYFTEASNGNSVPYDFVDQMLGEEQSATYTYVVVPGVGNAGDYRSVSRYFANKQSGQKMIAVVQRGTLNFKDKVIIAKEQGADAIIIYNNVAGTVRMSLEDIVDPIPTVSITMDAGIKLTADPNNPSRLRTTGEIEISRAYEAGPFMNDYSSWGPTPDLKLKPDVTSHGGEITSTVAGGYQEMSGTSMATPNLAGLMALVKDYLRDKNSGLNASELTRLTNQIVMSTATLVYDEEKLPYSPRKQGSGLATLANIFSTSAYLSTVENVKGGSEDNRPKIELYADKEKKGVYEFEFSVNNFGNKSLTFDIIPRFFTETLAVDGLAVAEAAYMLDDVAPVITVDGVPADTVTVTGGGTAKIGVQLTLSAAEKKYLDDSFANGMYVEGFISLASSDGEQCDLNLPFLGFYGDWEAAPMLDYDCYEMSEIDKSSLPDYEKPKESVFATQLYATYYNGKYAVPMGGFAYLQNEDDDSVEKVYVEEEHCAVSRFNIFNGPTAVDNYLTATGIRSLYAGLLRNAELVTFKIYNSYTGELVYEGEKYRVGKAYAGGGSAHPALVDLKLQPEEMGLINNDKYTMEFNFYRKADDINDPSANAENTFVTDFYVDYDAPVMTGSRIRYYDYEVDGKKRQRVYLDIDVYDNHYAQSVLLCYSEKTLDENGLSYPELNMCTDYVTPIYNANKNGTTTVSIEITDFYQKYKNKLYVQLDDYALNHTVYGIYFEPSNVANQSSDGFSISLADGRISKTASTVPPYADQYSMTLDVNEAYTVKLDCGSASPSNYSWTCARPDLLKVKDGEIFGVKAGTATLTVLDSKGTSYQIKVEIKDSQRKLPSPTISFGPIENSKLALQKAQGTVQVNAGQTFELEVLPDPWYYPIENLGFSWSSGNERFATVTDNGNGTATVVTKNERGNAVIKATMLDANGNATSQTASVTLSVQDPFEISNLTLDKYHGSEKVVFIPDDENIMYIGEEAFEDNRTMETVIIPRTVTQIDERAFLNCTALKKVCFIKEMQAGDLPEADTADLNLILADAFSGCTALETLDLTNCKVITVGQTAFRDCSKLKEIIDMDKIGIANDMAFAGCTSLTSIDISGLHTAGANVFAGCTSLNSVKTDRYTAIGSGMFYGCTSLSEIELNNGIIPGSSVITELNSGVMTTVVCGAFGNCTNLEQVTFGGDSTPADVTFSIGDHAFSGCGKLSRLIFNRPLTSVGDYAFANCTSLTSFTVPAGSQTTIGAGCFEGSGVSTVQWGAGYEEEGGAVYSGEILVRAPSLITSSFALKSGTTAIAAYAFADSKFDDGVDTVDLTGVLSIGEGAFYNSGIRALTIPAGVTAIEDRTFAYSALTSVTFNNNITSVGAEAFAGCASLEEVNFGTGDSLKSIGDRAFADCVALTAINLPLSAGELGNSVFAGCTELSEVSLSSTQDVGAYLFSGCVSLESVTFGAGSIDSGDYTFASYNGDSALVSVTWDDAMKVIGASMFYGCTSLQSIDLYSVDTISANAFSGCTSLSSVTGLDKVKNIGRAAFSNVALTELNLSAAEQIGARAFYNVSAVSLSIPAVKSLGTQAFDGIAVSSVTLPASLESFGDGVFANARQLTAVTVEQGNEIFFAEDGVLYKNVVNEMSGGQSYQLCYYPTARTAVAVDGQLTYTVKEGTQKIQGHAFSGAGRRGTSDTSLLNCVVLPYSVKIIGAGAFELTPITTYRFECINAPVLESEDYDTPAFLGTTVAYYTMYYTNFYNEFLNYADINTNKIASTLRIEYPTNGIGYDNYVFSAYFGTKVLLGELMDDTTRTVKNNIDGFESEETINSWMNLEVNDTNKQLVSAFSEKVKETHRLYNNIRSEKQLEFLNEGKDRAAILGSTEAALKPVKAKFGIAVKPTALRIAEDSAHKSEYKAGEKFDMTGLKLTVTYDDYSSENADMSLITLSAAFSGELTELNRYVQMEGYGLTVMVPITVTAADGGAGEEQEGGKKGGCAGCGGCGSIDTGTMAGGTGLLLFTLFGALLISQKLKARNAANKNQRKN